MIPVSMQHFGKKRHKNIFFGHLGRIPGRMAPFWEFTAIMATKWPYHDFA